MLNLQCRSSLTIRNVPGLPVNLAEMRSVCPSFLLLAPLLALRVLNAIASLWCHIEQRHHSQVGLTSDHQVYFLSTASFSDRGLVDSYSCRLETGGKIWSFPYMCIFMTQLWWCFSFRKEEPSSKMVYYELVKHMHVLYTKNYTAYACLRDTT